MQISSSLEFQRLFRPETLFRSLIKARKQFGGSYVIAEDAELQTLNYEQLITRGYALGQKIKSQTRPFEHVGILLPNSLAALASFFALQAYGRVAAILNFSLGSHAVLTACQAASIRIIYTSKRFIENTKLFSIIEKLQEHSITIIYLEELRKRISLIDKLKAKLKSKCASILYRWVETQWAAQQEAVILFTSGSEGTPKGVALSHLNIQANRAQVMSVLSMSKQDTVFNALPLFHSFGLTAGMLLPALTGIKIFLYPSPLHYQAIPWFIHKTKATVLFGTDTFLQGYAHYAKTVEFSSLRLVYAGAEKLKESTRELWKKKFNINLLEGYGTTETAPILSLNTPSAHKAGTVGRFLPEIGYRLIPIPGVKGGRLEITGPNVMLGYYHHHNPGILEPSGSIHDTGDIVNIDDEAFITLIGRAKRFAKIAGEMISLQAVELLLNEHWPNARHAVLSCTHPKHGEMLVLMTDCPTLTREEIVHHAKKQGLTELMCPKKIINLPTVPVLATGKINYPQLQKDLELQS